MMSLAQVGQHREAADVAEEVRKHSPKDPGACRYRLLLRGLFDQGARGRSR